MPQDLTAQLNELRQLIGDLQLARRQMGQRPQILPVRQPPKLPHPSAGELRFNLLNDEARLRLYRSREQSGIDCEHHWRLIERARRDLQLARKRLERERLRLKRERSAAARRRFWFW